MQKIVLLFMLVNISIASHAQIVDQDVIDQNISDAFEELQRMRPVHPCRAQSILPEDICLQVGYAQGLAEIRYNKLINVLEEDFIVVVDPETYEVFVDADSEICQLIYDPQDDDFVHSPDYYHLRCRDK